VVRGWAELLSISRAHADRCAVDVYYRPTVEGAYVDMLDMRSQVPFGIMRELHRWSAHAMVIMVMVHMFRVFMTAATNRRASLTGVSACCYWC